MYKSVDLTPIHTSDGTAQTGYDSANRLRQYQRGVLSPTIVPYRSGPGASVATPTTLPGADQTRTYDLDGLGNWKNTNWTLVGSGGSTTATAEMRQHNYVNEITSVRDTTGGTPTTTGFTYAHGNNTDGIQGSGNLANDGIRTYQWDAFNRLIQVGKVSGGATLAAYVYDALGRRIQKTVTNGGLSGDVPNATTSYLYDNQQIVEERVSTAPTVWTKVYFWGQYIDELMSMATPSTVYRVLSDLLYRGTALVNTSNVVQEAYDTDAYGNTLCYSGPGTDGLWFTDDDVRTNNPINPYIFTGRQFDPETQIYYYRARYYAPQWGRFISRDPIGVIGGINLYEYVGSSPCIKFDPSGLIPKWCMCEIVTDEEIKNLATLVALARLKRQAQQAIPDGDEVQIPDFSRIGTWGGSVPTSSTAETDEPCCKATEKAAYRQSLRSMFESLGNLSGYSTAVNEGSNVVVGNSNVNSVNTAYGVYKWADSLYQ